MAENSSGRSTLIAALLISFSIIGASFFVANSLDRTTAQLEVATEILEDFPIAAAAPGKDRPSRPTRPEPNREYEVALGAAPVRGGEDAVVTIVEWSDFQCPFCNRVTPTLAKIEEEYGDRVRFVFKHLPLSIHPQAKAAHAAAEAAFRQGKFWEMHDRIFANQRDLAVATLEGHALAIGLDMAKFRKDVQADDVAKRINDDLEQAAKLGVSGTPSFFINGKFLSGAQPFANFKRVIDEALEKS
ncbi:MAG: thioredoxin domain-containing protein [Myxococcota bacterium]